MDVVPGVRSAIRAFNAPRSDKRFLGVDWTADNAPIEAVEEEEVWSDSSGDEESASDFSV